MLLRAWPEIRRRTGARLRLIGTDPLQYRLLHARMRFDEDGIDVLGIVTNEVRTAELAAAKVFVSPALGERELRARARRGVRDRDARRRLRHPGLRRGRGATTRPCSSPPGDAAALADAVAGLLEDEPRRVAMGRAARAHAEERYSWSDVARRLEETYERVAA